jgi:Holliday junction resolvase
VSRRLQGYIVTEKEFAAQVVQLAKTCGWKVYRTWLPINSPAGFPDLVLVRGSEALFVELKSEKGTLKPAQEEWLNALQHVETVNAFCWRPCHWDMIEEALR